MHDSLFRITTIVADAWQNIALVTLIGTVGALRPRVRALEGAKAKGTLDEGEKAAMRAYVQNAIRSAHRATGRVTR
jgi:hypothetical protein